jgi:hypothetical protein
MATACSAYVVVFLLIFVAIVSRAFLETAFSSSPFFFLAPCLFSLQCKGRTGVPVLKKETTEIIFKGSVLPPSCTKSVVASYLFGPPYTEQHNVGNHPRRDQIKNGRMVEQNFADYSMTYETALYYPPPKSYQFIVTQHALVYNMCVKDHNELFC